MGNASDKDKTRKMFLDFLDVPSNHQIRTTEKGIYSSYSFGSGYKSYKVILLDLRYEKTTESLMYESQWEWLEKELNSEETFLFIGSSIQFLPINRFFGLGLQELWYLNERDRLMKLIGKLKRSGVILLSGDVHYAQILKTTCIHPDIGYHLYEHTSSGLSHINPSFTASLVNSVFPNTYQLHENIVSELNYGMIKFNWGESKEQSSIRLEINDIYDTLREYADVNYIDLLYNNRYESNHYCREEFRYIQSLLGFLVENPVIFIILVVICCLLISLIVCCCKCMMFIIVLPLLLLEKLFFKKKIQHQSKLPKKKAFDNKLV